MDGIVDLKKSTSIFKGTILKVIFGFSLFFSLFQMQAFAVSSVGFSLERHQGPMAELGAVINPNSLNYNIESWFKVTEETSEKDVDNSFTGQIKIVRTLEDFYEATKADLQVDVSGPFASSLSASTNLSLTKQIHSSTLNVLFVMSRDFKDISVKAYEKRDSLINLMAEQTPDQLIDWKEKASKLYFVNRVKKGFRAYVLISYKNIDKETSSKIVSSLEAGYQGLVVSGNLKAEFENFLKTAVKSKNIEINYQFYGGKSNALRNQFTDKITRFVETGDNFFEVLDSLHKYTQNVQSSDGLTLKYEAIPLADLLNLKTSPIGKIFAREIVSYYLKYQDLLGEIELLKNLVNEWTIYPKEVKLLENDYELKKDEALEMLQKHLDTRHSAMEAILNMAKKYDQGGLSVLALPAEVLKVGTIPDYLRIVNSSGRYTDLRFFKVPFQNEDFLKSQSERGYTIEIFYNNETNVWYASTGRRTCVESVIDLFNFVDKVYYKNLNK